VFDTQDGSSTRAVTKPTQLEACDLPPHRNRLPTAHLRLPPPDWPGFGDKVAIFAAQAVRGGKAIAFKNPNGSSCTKLPDGQLAALKLPTYYHFPPWLLVNVWRAQLFLQCSQEQRLGNREWCESSDFPLHLIDEPKRLEK